MDIFSIQPLLDWISLHPTWAGITVCLVALTESLAIVGLFMPGVILMFGIGTLIATGNLEFWPTLWWAVAGAIAGDGISFWLGAHYKEELRKLWPFSRYPNLLTRGENFFNRHGGKSILFGRFVGPIRPIIPATAGMLGMPPLQFLGINIISALAWAPAYLLPGIVFGTSLGLAAEVATRLSILLASIFIFLLFNVWLTKRIYHFFAPRASRLTNNVLLWGRKHKHLGRITATLVDPHHPETKGLTILGFSLIILAWFVVTIFQQFSVGPLLARLDSSSYHLIQQLRTPIADYVMVVISQLGDGVVHSVIIASLAIWLLWKKHWLAASHWLAAAAFASSAAWILKQSLHLPRPVAMFDQKNVGAAMLLPQW
jgi:undecaprenyl-diphosphatase